MRHRITIRDLGILCAALLVLLYIAFAYDIFEHQNSASTADLIVELDEGLLLGGLLSIGLLVFAVSRYLALQREIAVRIAAERKARELAYQDPLTGLPNRRQFNEALHAAVASPPRSGGVHALFLLDLNGFKQINDKYGHGTGDAVLLIVAQRLRQAVHAGDLVARLGGDEFIVLVEDLLGPEAATSIALRIIRIIGEPLETGRSRHHVGVGIGIALLPVDADSEEAALRKADIALYRAKTERRSAFRFFEQDMDRLVHERERLEQELRQALASGAISVGYRPAYDLRDGRVVGFEAVPVWRDQQGNEVPPERFLALAEETGLVHRLAESVLEQACDAAGQWPQDVTLSIDLFPGQLSNAELAESIIETCRDRGFDHRRLELEIAESTIVRDLETAKARLAPLREAGVRIALDHFGTGYSSLYHMQELRLDRVKIDRRFTENMAEEDARRIVRALAGLGQGLGIAVTADGVHGESASSSLIRSGVDVGQKSDTLVSSGDALRLFPPADGQSPA